MAVADTVPAGHLFLNGVDGATGGYLAPPPTVADVAAAARGEAPDADHLRELALKRRLAREAVLGVREGVDPADLASAGWGVVFAHDADPAVREALAPLLALRRGQAAARDPRRYREFAGAQGHVPGDTKLSFLVRHGVAMGPADPDKVPYYLLLVGSPEAIPFAFQYQLDVQYAVGRIHFDTPAEYAAYAAGVVAAESGPAGAQGGGRIVLPRQAVFFAPRHPGDGATAQSAAGLVGPLAALVARDRPGWDVRSVVDGEATRRRLAALLGGGAPPPALLFTASHGMGFPPGDPRQLPHQGALLCQDWPGPDAWNGPIPADFYLAGDHLDAAATPRGLVAFFFACYGGGTPRLDDFAHGGRVRLPVAPHAFLAALPRRLLAHPRGGALAVVAHVERAWSSSFAWPGAGPQLAVFEAMLKRLMDGAPVGWAMEEFGLRHAELSAYLAAQLEEIRFGKVLTPADELALAMSWTANNDARSWTVIGDPAVRLAVPAPAAAA